MMKPGQAFRILPRHYPRKSASMIVKYDDNKINA